MARQRIQGSIGYFGLEDWWMSAFSEQERRRIEDRFKPIGDGPNPLTSGTIASTSQTALGLLWALTTWFERQEDRPIAHKILAKGRELANAGASVIDVHFLFGQEVDIYYKDRDQLECMDKALRACRDQIALAPEAAKAFRTRYRGTPLPGHRGYQQLAIVLEKQGQFADAIQLCRQALEQGWSGDWAGRTERCQKKLGKAAAGSP